MLGVLLVLCAAGCAGASASGRSDTLQTPVVAPWSEACGVCGFEACEDVETPFAVAPERYWEIEASDKATKSSVDETFIPKLAAECQHHGSWACYILAASVGWDFSSITQGEAKKLMRDRCKDGDEWACLFEPVITRDDWREVPEHWVEACRGGQPMGCHMTAKLEYEKAGPNLGRRLNALYGLACNQGDPTACVMLAWHRWEGRLMAEDREASWKLYGRACELGFKPFCFTERDELGKASSWLQGVEPGAAQFFSLLYQSCRETGTSGCTFAGVLILGYGPQGQDAGPFAQFTGELWYEPCRRGDMLHCESGIALNAEVRARIGGEYLAALHRAECFKGNALFCTLAGFDNVEGHTGAIVSPDAARFYLQKGCDGGDGRGCRTLARVYREGWGVDEDLDLAAKLEQRACALGEARACVSSGVEAEPVCQVALERRACGLVGKDKGCIEDGAKLVSSIKDPRLANLSTAGKVAPGEALVSNNAWFYTRPVGDEGRVRANVWQPEDVQDPLTRVFLVEIVEDHGERVAVRYLSGPSRCRDLRFVIEYGIEFTWFVNKADLVARLARPMEVEFEDGTGFKLEPGLAITQVSKDTPGRYRLNPGIYPVELEVPPDWVVLSLPLLPPGSPFARSISKTYGEVVDRFDARRAVQVGGVELVPTDVIIDPETGMSLEDVQVVSPAGDEVLVDLEFTCATMRVRVAAGDVTKGKNTDGRTILRVLGTTTSSPGNRLVRKLSEMKDSPCSFTTWLPRGAKVYWPDGSAAGLADQNMRWFEEVDTTKAMHCVEGETGKRLSPSKYETGATKEDRTYSYCVRVEDLEVWFAQEDCDRIRRQDQ